MITTLISEIPSKLCIKDMANILGVSKDTLYRQRNCRDKSPLTLDIKDFCKINNISLSTVLRKIRPTLFLELKEHLTTTEIDSLI